MSNSDLINELISKEFEQQYFEECKQTYMAKLCSTKR